MAKNDSNTLRNVAVVGHGGTGKTSLCESFLFVSGKTEKPGRVDEGSSGLDYEPEEHKRRISISSAISWFDWNKHRVNFIDTPGDANFAMDTKNCLRVVDGVVDGRVERLRAVIEHALRDGGTVLIPAFSIGRTQELLYELEELFHSHGPDGAEPRAAWQELQVYSLFYVPGMNIFMR